LQQLGGIAVDRLDRSPAEQAGEHPLHHPPVLEEIGHPGGATQVVLEDAPGPLTIADQIQAGDLAPLAQWRGEALELRAPALGTLNVVPRDHPVAKDGLIAVDVGQKQINRLQALRQAPL